MSVAIVVPTIRKECWEKFVDAWTSLLIKHEALLITVWDGDNPVVKVGDTQYGIEEVCGSCDLIFNKNDGVRNLGFAFIAKYLPDVETIITLDDDVIPVGDTVQDHLDALNQRVPVSWLSTASEYMRGFPYGVRAEAEVVLSHGVWQGVKDYDAPTQLVNGNKDVTFYKGSIPKGVYYPMCGMNIAFKRKILPFMYYAPMGYKAGLDRFADIWLGIESKRIIDDKGFAVVSGYATVQHERASNVFKNLEKEARGIFLNESYWQGVEEDPYFKLYREKRNQWKEFIEEVSRNAVSKENC